MKKSFIIAIVIAVVAVLWILSGAKENGDAKTKNPAQQISQASEKNIPEVRVEDMSAEPMKDIVEITGRTVASRRVVLKAEIAGQVVSVLAKNGDTVEKGTLLAKLGLEDRGARVQEAEQLLNQRQIQFEAAKELAEKGFNSKVRLAEARAQLETAKAQLKRARTELSNIRISAPFNGIVNDQIVEVGDYVSIGSDLFDFVDLDPIEISGFVTEKQVSGIKEGQIVMATLLQGQEVEGTITFVAPAADPQTRTFKIEITLPNENNSIREGITAKIKIPVEERNAYRISPAILSLADDGTVGVKTVNSINQVEFVPIQLLKDTPEYLWVGGLPEQIKVITVGQEFVIDGQTVKPVSSTPNERP